MVKDCEPLDLYLEESLRAGDVQISDYREFSLSPGSARGNGFSPGTTSLFWLVGILNLVDNNLLLLGKLLWVDFSHSERRKKKM